MEGEDRAGGALVGSARARERAASGATRRDPEAILHRGLALVLIAVALAPFFYQASIYSHYVNDDAYITFRYARNLAEGRGPFFNSGERVEGYTSFFQMGQAALVIRLFGAGAAPGLMKFLGVLYGAGCVVLSFLAFQRIFGGAPRSGGGGTGGTTRTLGALPVLAGAFATAGIVAVTPGFAVNSTSGLETSCFAFFLCLGIFLGTGELYRGRWAGSGIAFGAALLTRPEGSVLFAAYWVACVIVVAVRSKEGVRIFRSAHGRLLLTNGAIAAGVFAAHMLFRSLAYDGELLPNTYYAKQGGFTGVPPATYMRLGLLEPVFGIAGLVVAAAGFLAAFAVPRFRFAKGRPTARGETPAALPGPLLPVAAIALTGGALPFLLGTDWMVGFRLVVPYLPAVAVIVVAGWMSLLSASRRVPRWGIAVLLGAAIVPLWFLQGGMREIDRAHTALRAQGYRTGHAAVASWIGDRAAPGECIALMDIGLIGYERIEQKILDLTGLTDRFIGRSPGGFLDKTYDPNYVYDRKPRFIVLTLTAPGISYTTPPPNTRFDLWSPTERRLIAHPDFRRHYSRPTSPDSGQPNDWPTVFAASLGADAVFEHGHPGRYCFLAVYQRRD